MNSLDYLLCESAGRAARFIGPWQTVLGPPKGLNLGTYYLSSADIVLHHKLTKAQLRHVPDGFLPLAVQSSRSVNASALRQMQRAVAGMSQGQWQSVYVPNRPLAGDNSGNGMTGIFLQRPDIEITVTLDTSRCPVIRFHWPRIRKYKTRLGVQPQNYNYSLVYHHYRTAFEAALNLLIDSTISIHPGFLEKLLVRKRVGLYLGVTDYYGDPDILPKHLLRQVLQANPNPAEVSDAAYLDFLRRYRESPMLPGNFHTDGIDKCMDVQGVFTILNKNVRGGQTVIRCRRLRRNLSRSPNGLREYDVAACLNGRQGHASMWVPSWGRSEVEHTPGPIQGGHRTILVFALDSGKHEFKPGDKTHRIYFGSQNETLSWDRRRWRPGDPAALVPDVRLWRAGA